MRRSARHQLRFGPYRTPRYRYGSVVTCEIQGDVRIVGTSNGRIPWPLARKPGPGGRSLVVYRDLLKAIQREAGIAVAFWWGVRADTVSRWRKALGVPRSNQGSHALWSTNAHKPWAVAARKKAVVKSKSPERLPSSGLPCGASGQQPTLSKPCVALTLARSIRPRLGGR